MAHLSGLKQQDTIAFESLAYQDMAAKWELPDTLLGGTKAIRAADTTYLPRAVHERPQSYQRRKARSFLFGAYKASLRRIVSKPFSKPITLSGIDLLPDQLEDIQDGAGPSGRNLDVLAREVFWEGVHRGLSHIFIDFPRVDGRLNLAQERDLAIRPYWVRISPKDLIRWTSERGPDGRDRLTEIVTRETRVEKVGNYAEERVEYIRISRAPMGGEAGTWELHRKVDGSDTGWLLVEEDSHSYPGVPLVTFYTNQTGFMTADPPMQDLAWLNLEHWQSSSDQSNILNVARVPILFRKGLDAAEDPENDGEVPVGPNDFTATNNPEADMKYVEHSGRAIASGEQSIDKIEQRMELLGMRPFVERTGGQTATGKAIDTSETDTDVRAWAREMGDVIEAAYRVSATWVNEELHEDFKAELHADFGINLRGTEDVKTLLAMRVAGELTREAYYLELKRRGFMGMHFDPEKEAELVAAEEPEVPPPAFGGEDDDEDEAA